MPIIIALGRRKSTRLLAILGGLVCSLGVLFTSFATQFHQLYFSYGLIVGSGVSLTKGTASIIVGQYFKKKRELVEIFVVSGAGIGLAATPLIITHSIRYVFQKESESIFTILEIFYYFQFFKIGWNNIN